MAGTLTIPLTTLAAGVHDFPASGGQALADTDRHAVLRIDRTVTGGFASVPASTTALIEAWQSSDGGSTWLLVVGGTMVGGPSPVDPATGQPFTFSQVQADFTPGTSRIVKARVTVSGASVAVQGTLTIS